MSFIASVLVAEKGRASLNFIYWTPTTFLPIYESNARIDAWKLLNIHIVFPSILAWTKPLASGSGYN